MADIDDPRIDIRLCANRGGRIHFCAPFRGRGPSNDPDPTPGYTACAPSRDAANPIELNYRFTRAGIDWQLAPVDFIWFGKSGAEICAQLKNPNRNGGRDAVALLEHLRHDASLSGFIPRAWEPGAGRSTPPGNFEEHVKDMALWGAAGQPCPN